MIVEESATLKIEIDSGIVGDHTILLGTGRISRNKEHFDGLLNAIHEENSAVYEQIVEKRDLKRYEEVLLWIHTKESMNA